MSRLTSTLLKEGSIWRVKSYSPSGVINTDFFESLDDALSYIKNIIKSVLKDQSPYMIPRFELDCIE